MKVTLSQMRNAVLTAVNLTPKQLGCRESEADLLKEHLKAVDQLLRGHEEHPDIMDALRKAMLADRGVVL